MYKLNSFVVDSVLSVWQRVPGPVIHNLEKARALKKIFWHLNVDGITGDYLEFGVAHGHSMRAAEIAEKSSHSKSLGIMRVPRQLYGFDTFEKFIGDPDLDSHPTWEGESFNVPYKAVKLRFLNSKNIHLFKLDVNNLILDPDNSLDKFGLKSKAAVILFDMDLYGPTRSALFWVAEIIQQGTFLVFDEFFAFGGDQRKGEARALKEFLEIHPEFTVREFANYGSGGKIFVVDLV